MIFFIIKVKNISELAFLSAEVGKVCTEIEIILLVFICKRCEKFES